MQTDIFPRYDVILADPPWAYSDRGQSGSLSPSGAAVHYDTLTDDQIAGINVADVAADDALLFMWVTGPHLVTGLRVMEAWGFTFRTVAFTWIKTGSTKPAAVDLRRILRRLGVARDALRAASKEARAAGLLASRYMMGQGSYTRANPEFVLLGRRGKGAPVINRGVRSEVLAPRGAHSAKPNDVHERIEALCGDVRRLEMFARDTRPGWDAWGNEVACDVRLRVPS